MMQGCQWVGPDQDPARDYPMKYCGAQTVEGKHYCHEHYFRVYQKGTSVNGKRISKMIEKEIEEFQKLEEIAEIEEMTDV
jgi:hypothetical protein